MFKNIKHNNVRGLNLRLRNDKYYDFMLYRGECKTVGDCKGCVVANITPYNLSEGKVYSESIWEDAINNGVLLNNIGLTGMDNGIISFRKDKITNSQFLKLYTESQYEIKEGDKRFFMSPVTGSTGKYYYPYTLENDSQGGYISLKGGFLQGFYKLHDEDYQTLPNVIEGDLNMEFVIRPKNYAIDEKTINYKHPNNEGIFFYMGTRAENKFWSYYKCENNMEELIDVDENYFEDDFFQEDKKCEWFDYSCDDMYFNSEEYYDKEISLEGVVVKTDKGHEMDKRGYIEIKTDNKFLTFDATKYGFTTKTFNEDEPYVVYEGRNDWGNINYFPLMNQTKTGYTVDNISSYNEENVKGFDLYDDIRNNAFALKINKDGSISYRYGVTDCDSENRYRVEEEVTKPNLVTMDEWSTINVRFTMSGSNSENCGRTKGNRKMKICIYVNGNLVFISKPLPEFDFRGLNDVKEKQESVAYNISLGGGTQGLCDAIWMNDDKSRYILPLERDFCGSFLGDIKSFKMYNCFLDYKSINDNVFGV